MDEISKEAREEEEEVGENLEVVGSWLTTAPLHLRVLLISNIKSERLSSHSPTPSPEKAPLMIPAEQEYKVSLLSRNF